MGRDREPKLNPDRDIEIERETEAVVERHGFSGNWSEVRHPVVPIPAEEIFTREELNRLTEVQRNSPEQENNQRRFGRLGEKIKREVNEILNRAFPITPVVRVAGMGRR